MGMHDKYEASRAEVARLKAELEKASAEALEWRKVAQTITPGGSEYMDRERVRQHINEVRESRHRDKVRLASLKKENNKLREALEGALSFIMDHVAVSGPEGEPVDLFSYDAAPVVIQARRALERTNG